jgi:hypothetical protein
MIQACRGLDDSQPAFAEGGGHLAAAGVMDTHEQDLGGIGHGRSYREMRATRKRANAAQVVASWIQLIVK